MRKLRWILVSALTTSLAILSATVVGETYSYDAAGHIHRIIHADGTATRYRYDALGNLTAVSPDTPGLAPIVTSLTPTTVATDSTRRIEVAGRNLATVKVTTPTDAFHVSGLSATSEHLAFDLRIDADAPLGNQRFRLGDADGVATFDLLVVQAPPRLVAGPLPLALPQNASVRQIAVGLSRADSAARTIHLTVADPGIAALVDESVAIAAGETKARIGMRGLKGGMTRLTLASDGLESASYAVYVTAEYGNVSSTYASVLGLRVGDGDNPSPEGRQLGWSDRLGVTRGPVVTSIAPNAVSVGSGGETLMIRGSDLAGVEQVTIEPPEGVTLSELDTLADGTQVLLTLAVAPDAARGPRRLVLGGTAPVYPPAAPGADLIDIVAPPPVIDSLEPHLALRGTTAAMLTIRGHHLDRIQGVTLTPADGVALSSTPEISADGRRLRLRYSIAPDAPLGERLVRVLTPAGASTEVLSVHNRFSVVDSVVGERTPVVAPLLGMQVGTDGSTTAQTLQFTADPLGLTVGAYIAELSPRTGIAGANLALRLSGQGLDAVSAVRFEPADGIAVTGLTRDPLGDTLLVQLEIDAAAAQTPRQMRVFANETEIPFGAPGAARFLVTADAPWLGSVHPNTLRIGSGVRTLVLHGTNLDRASRVRVEPAAGIVLGAPEVNADGIRLDVRIEANAQASEGAHVVTVTTPAGQTSNVPGSANTLILHRAPLTATTPLMAPLLGVQRGADTGGERIIDPLLAPLVGLAVGSGGDTPTSGPFRLTAPLLGLSVGAVALAVETPPLLAGETLDVRIRGSALDTVDSVGIDPGQDLSISTPMPSTDGTQLNVKLTVPPDAEIQPRQLRLAAGTEPVLFANPARALVELAPGVPQIDSIQPIVARPGETLELVIRGRHIQGARQVLATPANGLVFASALTIDAAGSVARVRLHVADDAVPGARVIRIATPGGLSAIGASAANTFTIH